MILGNERNSKTPSGFRVAGMSYKKLEEVAMELHPLLPKVPSSSNMRIDAWRTLEITLRKAGFEYRSEEQEILEDTAAFTIPLEGLIVFRQDVYDGIETNNVFSRSTVIHELSHIVLKHAVTLKRGTIGEHRFFEDSEWQAKALTAAIMMPLEACRSVGSARDLAMLCGTSEMAARYRLERLIKDGLVAPKPEFGGLFD